MNRKLLICVLALALLCLLAGCKKDQVDMPAVETTEPTVEETTLPEDDTTFVPEVDGVESIEEMIQQGVVDTQPDETESAATTPDGKNETPQKPGQEPTKPSATEPSQEQTPATEPEKTPDTQPTEPPATEAPTTPPVTGTSCGCEYQRYMAMSAADQEAYMNSFESPLAFIEWMKQAQADHEAHDTSVKVEGGDLDISDFIDNQNP